MNRSLGREWIFAGAKDKTVFSEYAGHGKWPSETVLVCMLSGCCKIDSQA
jgi:hypothetical protein